MKPLLLIICALALTSCKSLEGYTFGSKACYVDKYGNQYCLSNEGKKVYFQTDIKGFSK